MPKIEIEREDDGRWIAELKDWPYFLVYGETRELAIAKVQALTLRNMAATGTSSLSESDLRFCMNFSASFLALQHFPNEEIMILALKKAAKRLEKGDFSLNCTTQDLLEEYFKINEPMEAH